MLEPIFHKDAIEARFIDKTKSEADLEQLRERRLIMFVSLWAFRCRAVLVDPFKSCIPVVWPGGTAVQR